MFGHKTAAVRIGKDGVILQARRTGSFLFLLCRIPVYKFCNGKYTTTRLKQEV